MESGRVKPVQQTGSNGSTRQRDGYALPGTV